jgi:hypothetical protein
MSGQVPPSPVTTLPLPDPVLPLLPLLPLEPLLPLVPSPLLPLEPLLPLVPSPLLPLLLEPLPASSIGGWRMLLLLLHRADAPTTTSNPRPWAKRTRP